jgi:hypothetical protein
MVLKQAYTEVFKIGNTDNDPFDLVSVRPADGFQELNPVYRLIEDYSRYHIMKYYGLSLDKFGDMPRHITAHLIEIAEKRQDKENSSVEDLNNDINASMRKQEQLAKRQADDGFPGL